MHTVTMPVTMGTTEHSLTRPRPVRRRFYVGLALFMTAIVVAGFWPSYFGPLFHGNVARPWVIQLHGVIFVGWMALLLAQVVLVSRGRTRLHRKLGTFGIVYGCLVLVMGLVVSFAAPLLHLAAGEWDMDRAAGFLPVPLGDMMLFGTFFGSAIVYRRQPEIHKRLILTATTALLFAAVGRIPFIESLFPAGVSGTSLIKPLLIFDLVWLSPLLVGMAYDWITCRRVHPAYVIGTVGLLIGSARILFTQSESWLRIGRPLLNALM